MAIRIKRAQTGSFTHGTADDSSAKTLVDRQLGYERGMQRLVYNDAGTLNHFSADEALGFYSDYCSLKIGPNSRLSSMCSYSVLFGPFATTRGYRAVVIGFEAEAEANGIAIGYEALTNAVDSVAIGHSASSANSTGVVVLGHNARVTAGNAVTGGVAIGLDSNIAGQYAVAIGSDSVASSSGSVAIGQCSWANGWDSVAIGSCISALANYSIALGSVARARGNFDIVIGSYAETTNSAEAVVIGANAYARSSVGASYSIQHPISIGFNARTYNTNDGIAIGSNAQCTAASPVSYSGSIAGIAIGKKANCYYQNFGVGIAIGENAVSTEGGIALGTSILASAYSIAIGRVISVPAEKAIAIGCNVCACSTYSVAVGANSGTPGQSAIAIGYGSLGNAFSVAIGACATAMPNSIAIGYQADASAANTIVLGNSKIQALKCKVTSITSLSDERSKENIELANLARCLEIVESLPLKRFSFKKWASPNEYDKTQLGFIAQDVEQVFPKSVFTTKFVDYPEFDDEGNVQYEAVTDEKGRPVYEELTTDQDGNKIYKTDDKGNKIPLMKEKTFRLENVKEMNTGQIMMALWGAVQQLTKRVKELEAK